MDFKTIKVEPKDDKALIIILEERIYLGVTDVFREDILAVLEQDYKEFIINLNKVMVMNSAGLGVLIMAQDIIKKRNGLIKLTNLQPLMQDIFTRMRLDTLFEIYENEIEALSK